MSIKKVLLEELTEKQLKDFAESKGVKIDLSDTQKRYYADWEEREILVDMISDKEDVTVREIEEFLKLIKS